MPKKVEYPNCSIEKALELAKAIDAAGDNVSREIAASSVGLKNHASGGFTSLVSGTIKYGLLQSQKDSKLGTTKLYKDIKLAYSDDERTEKMREAFFNPPLFKALYEKYVGRKIPVEILTKILIKEHQVEEDNAQRIGGYFTKGLAHLKLIGTDGNVISLESNNTITTTEENTDDGIVTSDSKLPIKKEIEEVTLIQSDTYYVQFVGPGINTRIEINDVDDLDIVNAVLNKIRKKVNGSN